MPEAAVPGQHPSRPPGLPDGGDLSGGLSAASLAGWPSCGGLALLHPSDLLLGLRSAQGIMQLHGAVHRRSMWACAKVLLYSVSERKVTLTPPALAAGPHRRSVKGDPPFCASASPRQGGRRCSQYVCSVHAAQVGTTCTVFGLQGTPELSRQWALCKPASLRCRWDAVMQVEDSQAFKCGHDKVGIDRWQPGMTFGEFTERTVQAYYKPAVHSADNPVLH